MDLKKITSLAENDLFKEALEECHKHIIQFPEEKADIYRTRAYVFSLAGEYNKAVKDRKKLFAICTGNIMDYYLAADNALSANLFLQASIWFKEVLRLGKEENETWFESGSYFLLAYTEMKLGNYQVGLSYLENVVILDPDCAMPLPSVGMCTSDELQQEITRKAEP